MSKQKSNKPYMAFESTTTSTHPEYKTLREFFERVPPGQRASIRNLGIIVVPGLSRSLVRLPAIRLHCEAETCKGITFFESVESDYILEWKESKEHFVIFHCRNCQQTQKTYALRSYLSEDGVNGELFKFGEQPFFGWPTSARVITLVGAERDYYLKGRRSENQGLGIAAFAYYRRVIENQKDRILDEFIRVSEQLGASQEILDDLNTAKREIQFSKAVGLIKHSIPQALLINGHNPLLLLHSALSEGLHAQTDEQCLEFATSIRLVLTDLTERLASALKEEAELSTAVNRLLLAGKLNKANIHHRSG